MKHFVEGFLPLGGQHCITNALKQVFNHYGYPMSEEMLFGIGAGLGFTYINLANSPMISGRSKPQEFEEKLAGRLGIVLACKQPKNGEIAFEKAKKMLTDNQPVLIYVDMAYLPYLNLDTNSHFGGHAVVLAGFDDDAQLFYLSDRDNHDSPIATPKGECAADYHSVGFLELAQARGSAYRPFPANNKYIEPNFQHFEPVCQDTVRQAIADTCQTMLYPPAKLMGISGIKKFAREIVKWEAFEREKRKRAGITNFFQIHKDGGTGGGIFRKLYGGFLIEADSILPKQGLAKTGAQFIALSEEWDMLADIMWELAQTGDCALLAKMSEQISRLGETEETLLTELQAVSE